MKKTIVMILAVVGLAQHVFAANGLWLEKRDGNKIGYLFDEEVTISYNSTSVVMTSQNASVEYPFSEVHRVYFGDDVTSNASTSIIEKQQQIRIFSNGLELKGFTAGTLVTISNLTGSFYTKRVANADGILYIKWSDMPHGVFIVKADKTTIKFNNK